MRQWTLPAYLQGRGILFWLIMLLVVIPGVPAVLVSIGFFLYVYWPIGLDQVEMPEPAPRVEHLILLSHGVGDSSDSWAAKLAQTLNRDPDRIGVFAIDWNPYSQNALRCSVDGKRLGRRLGEHILDHPQVKSVHLIGHSCGAFINLGVCQAIKADRPELEVQTTFLDAVSVYGAIFWNYGLDHFGTCADFSDAYIDTGDGVPGSNQRLPAAHTFDVSNARLSSGYTGSPHVWPTEFYQQLAEQDQIPDLSSGQDLRQRYPAGELVIID